MPTDNSNSASASTTSATSTSQTMTVEQQRQQQAEKGSSDLLAIAESEASVLRKGLEKKKRRRTGGGEDTTPGAVAVDSFTKETQPRLVGLRGRSHSPKNGTKDSKTVVNHASHPLDPQEVLDMVEVPDNPSDLLAKKKEASNAGPAQWFRNARTTEEGSGGLEKGLTMHNQAARYAYSGASNMSIDTAGNDTITLGTMPPPPTNLTRNQRPRRPDSEPGAFPHGTTQDHLQDANSIVLGGETVVQDNQVQQHQQTGDILLEATLVPDNPPNQQPTPQQPPVPPQPEDNNPVPIPEAEILEPESLRAKWLQTSTTGKIMCLFITILILGLVLTASVCGTTGVCSANNQQQTAPSPPSTSAPTMAPTPYFLQLPNYTLQQLQSNLLSVQYKAYDWVMMHYDFNSLTSMSQRRREQIFAMACFLYAFNGTTLPNILRDTVQTTSTFNESVHECDWDNPHFQIECHNDTGLITQLGIQDAASNMVGSIPPEIELLSDLEAFWMEEFKLTGNLHEIVPPQMANLHKLRKLSLDDNSMRGNVASALYDLTKLTYLNIHRNAIAGTISSHIGLMTDLIHLDTSSNSLRGQMPTQMGLLTKLTRLELHRNEYVSGTVPTEFTRLSLITYFVWQNMDALKGTIPTQIGLMTQLTSIDFSRTSLTGTIPSELGRLSLLKKLELHANGLSGTVPESICGLTQNRTELTVNDCPGNSGGNNDFASPNHPVRKLRQQQQQQQRQSNGNNNGRNNDNVNAHGNIFCPETCRCRCGR